MHGFVSNEELLKHYQSAFGAEHIGALHPYQFYIPPDDGAKITEEYDYEWTRASLQGIHKKTSMPPPNINDYQERAFDYLGMIRYAKSKGISAAELSPEEKRRFLIKS